MVRVVVIQGDLKPARKRWRGINGLQPREGISFPCFSRVAISHDHAKPDAAASAENFFLTMTSNPFKVVNSSHSHCHSVDLLDL